MFDLSSGSCLSSGFICSLVFSFSLSLVSFEAFSRIHVRGCILMMSFPLGFRYLLGLGVDINNIQCVFDFTIADSAWKKWKGTYRQVHTGVT